jgi:hypothetical protein
MKGRQKSLPFKKTAICPSSSTLLSFQVDRLSPEIAKLVKFHLKSCEFCNAELSLLTHHQKPQKRERAPEIPMNLRILAESLLCRTSRLRIIN